MGACKCMMLYAATISNGRSHERSGTNHNLSDFYTMLTAITAHI